MEKFENAKSKVLEAKDRASDFCLENLNTIVGGAIIAGYGILALYTTYGIGKFVGANATEKLIAKTSPEAYKEIVSKLSVQRATEYIAKLK